jgi:hypothetical protein
VGTVEMATPAASLVLLAGLLIGSQPARVVAWECIAHPLSRGRLVIRDGQATVRRDGRTPAG